ncbi:MAG: sensor domain-containing diguanylate cyclase [Deltaproteobacteria bacterium]|nr:sensor domain-containing diguanylate cyclase [Deltaproteobacteria bacterium]
MKKKDQPDEKGHVASELRIAAETKLRRLSGTLADRKEKESEKLLHELQVHQIELEMQNDELRTIQLAQEESRDKYLDLYDFAPVGYVTFTPEALIQEINLTGAALLGMDRQKLINSRFRRMVAGKDQDRWGQHFLSVLQQGERQSCELTLKKAEGSTFQAKLDSARQELKTGTPLVRTTINNISEIKQTQEALRESEQRFRELSITDNLTQLFNQRHLYQQLQQEIERTNRYQHQLALLLLDLDDFKLFNDTYGHLEGDEVLVKTAQIIRKCIRQTDSAFRFGGEEFVVILPETSLKKALILAERIRKGIQGAAFHPAPKAEVHLTCSVGLSQYQSLEGLKTFIKRVDQNMYQAKVKGKNQCYFS